MKKNILILSFLIFSLLTGQKITYATGDFTVHPTYIHDGNKSWIIKNIPAGETFTDFITLENSSEKAQKITLEIYEAREDDKGIFKPSNSKKYNDLGMWTKIPETTHHLGPYEKRKIPVIFTIPATAERKKYMGVIYAIQNKEGINNITFITRIGVRIYLNITNPPELQTNIFNSPEYTNTVFFVLSLAGLMGSIFYNLIHFLENRKYENHSF